MARAEDIIAVALSQVSDTAAEDTNGSTKYHEAYEGTKSTWEWCCAFVWWVFKQADASELFFGGGKTAGCQALYDYYNNNVDLKTQIVTTVEELQKGDVVFFQWGESGKANHVGICYQDYNSSDGNIYSIDGNTGSSDDNSSKYVYKKTRDAKDTKIFYGAYRPAYNGKSALMKVQNIQISLLELLGNKWNQKDENGNQVIDSNVGEEYAKATVKGTNPWHEHFQRAEGDTEDKYMLTQEQYLSMAAAINTFYDCCKKAVTDLNNAIPADAKDITYASFNKPNDISLLSKKNALDDEGNIIYETVNGQRVPKQVETLIGFDFITADSFNKMLDAIVEYTTDHYKDTLKQVIKTYTSNKNASEIDKKLQVIADDTFVAEELFKTLGEAASAMNKTFEASWTMPKEEEEEDSDSE